MKRLLIGATALAAIGSLFVMVQPGKAKSEPTSIQTAPTFPEVPANNPDLRIPLLFIHHSCGGQLLAPEGPDNGDNCIYKSHPSGGNLRAALEAAGYDVHEASYKSVIGNNTDLFDWVPKFAQQMDRVLRIKRQNELLPNGQVNRVVVFKSCFPNNQFTSEGVAPGNPEGPTLTVWNARATLKALLPIFAQRPETLFIYVTPPPIAPKPEKQPLYRAIIRAMKGRFEPGWSEKQGSWAREMNDWVVSPNGWLAEYPLKNVVVFDYYGVLTDNGKSNLLVYTTTDETDSHPSAEGNSKAAQAFLPLVNRAVRRAGLLDGSQLPN